MDNYKNGVKSNKKKRKWIYVCIGIVIICVGALTFIVYKKNIDNNPQITKCIKKVKYSASTTGKEEPKVAAAPTNNPVRNIPPFLDKFGWTIVEFKKIEDEEIPSTFEVKEDELPYGVIWAYNNELSKVVGLDFSPYKGKKVKNYTIGIKNKSFDDQINVCNIIIYEDKIIGAWIGNNAFSENVLCQGISMTIDKLAPKLCKSSYRENINEKFKNSNQQEILKNYIDAINKKDYKLAYYLLDFEGQIEKCITGEKNISDKIFAEEKIEMLTFEKNPNFQGNIWVNEENEEMQLESFIVYAKVRSKGEKEEAYRYCNVEFMKRGSKPWKIRFISMGV